MSNVILCYGKYAKNPYFVADDCLNLYSVEELCYYFYHHAYLMEDSFITVELIQWIRDELELDKLAEQMEHIIHTEYAVEKTIKLLIHEVGYYSKDEWEEKIN